MDLIKIFRMLDEIHKSQRRSNYISVLKELYEVGDIRDEEYIKRLKAIASMEGFEA